MMISIIIPVYNAEKYIARCLQSLLDQTYKDFEAIIVDDGSSDHSVEIIKSMIEDDSRFFLLQKENGGKHTAINMAASVIHGRYALILDSDDFLMNESSLDSLINNITEAPINIFLHQLSRNKKFDSDMYDLELFCKMRMDVVFCVETRVLLENLFPEFEGERFVTEAVVWNKILDVSPAFAHSIVIVAGEYLATGLSAKYFQLLENNPQGVLALIQTNHAVKNNSFSLMKQSASHYASIMNSQYNRKLLNLVGIRYGVLIIFLAIILKIKKLCRLI